MVVVAIIAILATVATPAYKLYVTKTKLNMANNFVQSQVDASIRYYNDNGVFGNIAQIGLPTDGDPDQTPAPTGGNGYLQGNVAQMTMNASTSTCNSGSASAYVSNFGEGDASADSTADLVVLQHVYFDIDDIIVKRCQYTYYKGGLSGTSLSGSFVSECVNTVDNPGYEAATLALIDSCN